MRALRILIALTLVLAACGDEGKNDERLMEDPGSAEDGDTGFLIGADLDLPSWFAPDFYIPDDLSITTVSNDGIRMTLYGVYESGGNAAALQQQMIDRLIANGYEFLTDAEVYAVFIRDGLGRVRLRVTDQETPEGVKPALDVDIDLWTDEQIAELRALFEG